MRMGSGGILLHWLQDTKNDEIWENTSWSSYHNLSNVKYDDLSTVTPFTITLESLEPFSQVAVDILLKNNKIPFTTSAAHLGLTTGLILALILNLKAYKKSEVEHWLQEMILRSLFAAICLILAMIVAPLVGVIIILLICYHQGVHFFLKFTQQHYVELFEGLDAIWAVEEETSRSIINVLMFIEVQEVEQGKNLLQVFRNLVVDRLATPPLPCSKLFYLRRQCLGYFYWENQEDINIEDYIRPMTIIPPKYQSTKHNNDGIPEETLKNYVAEISNTTLPKDHGACWEVLVGSYPVIKSSTSPLSDFTSREDSTMLQYPIVIRVHHSLGDGIALMQLLISAITDDIQHRTSQTCVASHSPKLPPMPIPVRKFPNSSKVHGKFENTDHKLQTQECCTIDTNNFLCKHQGQHPPDWNSNQLRKMSHNNQDVNDRKKKITYSKDSLVRYQTGSHSKTNEISIDLQSIEENEVETNDSCTNFNTVYDSLSVSPDARSKRNALSVLNCRQRPLLLNQEHEPSNQQSEYQWQLLNNKHTNSNLYPTPQHSQNFKNIQTKLNVCSSKISASCDISPGNFSQSLSSNFQTSLPILNLYQSPKNYFKGQKSPLNSKSENHVVSRNGLADSNQNARYQSITPTETSIKEPPIVFNNLKKTISYSVPKNLSKLPRPSQNTTLPCYNRTMSDSYITIPEEVACSSVETTNKSTSASTIIYYYSPASSPQTPVQYSDNSVIGQTIPQTMHENNSLQKTLSTSSLTRVSLQGSEKDSISEESSAESNFAEINIARTPRETKTANLSSTKPVTNCSSNTIQHHDVQYLDWHSGCINEPRKTKSDAELNTKPQTNSPGLQVQSTVNIYSDYENFCNKKISRPVTANNADVHSFNNTSNMKNCEDRDCVMTKETQISFDHQEEQHSHSWLRRLNWYKLRSNNRETQCRSNKDTFPKYEPEAPNQYVDLLNAISNSTTSLNTANWFSQFTQTICAIALSPASLIHQVLMKAKDTNILHGPPLSGYKVIAWHTDQNGKLFNSIKKVKNICKTRFTEVFLSALSASLETYYETHQVSCNDRIPEVITVVIPARMEPVKCPTTCRLMNTTPVVTRNNSKQKQSNVVPVICTEHTDKISRIQSKSNAPPSDRKSNKERGGKLIGSTFSLNNRFSVAMLQLPVSQVEDTFIKQSPKNRLNAVHNHSEQLRKSLDYQVNYWLLRVVATYLPKALLEAVVQSSQSTLVVSNIMGPIQELSFAGNKLQDIMFWVPHRGMTGIGITVLSYMERLQIGIMADRALIHCKEDAQMILDELVAELCKLDAASTCSAGSTQ